MLFQGVLPFKQPSYSAENKREEVVVDQVEYHYVGEKAKKETTEQGKSRCHQHPLFDSVLINEGQQQYGNKLYPRNTAQNQLRADKQGGEYSR